MTEIAHIADSVAALFWTYLIHSTMFIALCMAAIYIVKPRSQGLTAWCWKSAATLPIVTSIVTFMLSMNSMQFGYLIKDNIGRANPSSISRSNEVVFPHFEPLTSPNSVANPDAAIDSKSDNNQLQHSHSNPMPAVPFTTRSHNTVRSQKATASFAIVALLACTLCWSVVKFMQFCVCYRKLLKSSTECRSGRMRDELDRFLKFVSIERRVRLLISDHAKQPFALGILRWTIVVPRQVEVALDKKQLRALFAHEIGHLVRRDAIRLVIGAFICTFLVFQPLNVHARRRWLDASEFLADEWAVQSGADALSLVRCLTSVAEWQSSAIIAIAMRFTDSSAHALTRRAEHLLSDRVKKDIWSISKHRIAANFALMLLGTVFMFFGPHVGKLSAVDSGSARSPENALLETQLDGIIDQLREVKVNLSQVNVQTGVNRVDGLFDRVEQLKRRSALLVERAVRISELCKRDLR